MKKLISLLVIISIIVLSISQVFAFSYYKGNNNLPKYSIIIIPPSYSSINTLEIKVVDASSGYFLTGTRLKDIASSIVLTATKGNLVISGTILSNGKSVNYNYSLLNVTMNGAIYQNDDNTMTQTNKIHLRGNEKGDGLVITYDESWDMPSVKVSGNTVTAYSNDPSIEAGCLNIRYIKPYISTGYGKIIETSMTPVTINLGGDAAYANGIIYEDDKPIAYLSFDKNDYDKSSGSYKEFLPPMANDKKYKIVVNAILNDYSNMTKYYVSTSKDIQPSAANANITSKELIADTDSKVIFFIKDFNSSKNVRFTVYDEDGNIVKDANLKAGTDKIISEQWYTISNNKLAIYKDKDTVEKITSSSISNGWNSYYITANIKEGYKLVIDGSYTDYNVNSYIPSQYQYSFRIGELTAVKDSNNNSNINKNSNSSNNVQSNHVVQFKLGNLSYNIDNNIKSMDVSPFIYNGRTFIPIRFLADALGANTSWDNSTHTVVIKKDNILLNLKIDSRTMIVNNNGKISILTLDVAPRVTDANGKSLGRTMLPARYIAEQLGYNVTYNNDTITISQK